MNSVVWEFQPVDTWFFRRGAPFGIRQSVGIRDIAFAPPVSTLQGAVRTAMARKQGWTPQHPELWPDVLGTPDSLGAMTLKGPYLSYKTEYLFPSPHHLLRADDGLIRLRPGDPVETDMGFKPLPVLERHGKNVATLQNAWITYGGLVRLLQGDCPLEDQVLGSGALWRPEARTGLMINTQTRTAEQGMLFHTVHSRFTPSTRVSLEVSGIPEEWHQGIHFVPLGGEGRFAQVTTMTSSRDPIPCLPTFSSSPSGSDVTVFGLLLTPGIFENPEYVIREGPLAVSCMTGVVGRVEMQGGWDMQRQRPRPLRPVVPAGSVWFYHLTRDQWDVMRAMHGKQVGQEQEYGYGQIVFGIWKEKE